MTKRSPLDARHLELGAKMADFGGWLMPIEYSAAGGGILKEHAAVRESVGIFDVSHLGKATVRGPGAREFVNRVLSNDLDRVEPGQAQYTLCCNAEGGIIDDLIAYLVSAQEVFLVPNAANTAVIVQRLLEVAPAGVEVHNEHEDFGIIAVQGPRSAAVLARLGLPADLPYMAYVDASHGGAGIRICRTGYTGERGYELITAWDQTPAVWDALVEVAGSFGGRVAGLGSRDTLRTEMGYPLHGQDLSPTISALQARLSWAVGWSKQAFWGREALLAERADGPVRQLWGIEALDRGIPRPHMAVLDQLANPIGDVTSGTFSPTLKKGIGLALLDASAGILAGSGVLLDVRGRTSSVRVTKPPFVESHVR